MNDENGNTLEAMDIEAFYNMRMFVESALEAKGAVVTDAGLGNGRADIGIEVEGFAWRVMLEPRMVAPKEG